MQLQLPYNIAEGSLPASCTDMEELGDLTVLVAQCHQLKHLTFL